MKTKQKGSKQAPLKQSTKPDKTNPFEIRLNKQKHSVLGRKSKNDRGLPGVSRNKAIQKRKASLLQEYVHRNKSNTFLDRRIGESDSTMNPDDKIAARLALELKVAHKKSVFSLNDDEELTHLGRSVLSMETHDDPRSDDEDLYDKVSKEFAERTNFGGFLTKTDPNSDSAKSRKEAIDELIAHTKKLKYERQVAKDENFALTEKLDSEWKEFRSLVATGKKQTNTEDSSTKETDYDLLVKQLRFEPRAGHAMERVKTEDEVAREERKRLEKLEKERQLRSKGDIEEKMLREHKHVSADDLDDGFYKLEPITKEADAGDESGSNDEANEEEDTAEESPDAEEGDEGDSDSYSDLESEHDEGSDIEEAPRLKGNNEKQDREEAEGSKGSKRDDDEENKLEPPQKKKHVEHVTGDAKLLSESKTHTTGEKVEASNACRYTAIPNSEGAFMALVAGKTANEQAEILASIISGNRHNEYYRRKFEIFFVILLQYLNDVADSDVRLADILCPHIYALVQLSPVTCSRFLVDVISEKEEELRRTLDKRPRFSVPFPRFSSLVFLRIVGQCYSTSDFSHRVVTPAMISMSQMLCRCSLRSATDFLRGIFIANVFLEYVWYSKRFVPELCCFLTRLLKKENIKIETLQQVRVTKLRLTLNSLTDEGIQMTDELRVRIVHAALKLAGKCAEMWMPLPSFQELADNMVEGCRKIDVSLYPETVKSVFDETVRALSTKAERKPLRPEKKPPPMKALLEPKFQAKFDGRKHFTGSKKKVEMKRLGQKYKREMKGAMREVRRDNQFLAQHQLNEQIEKDEERKRKVKQIYRELATQEGDYKKLKRKKW